MNKEAIKKALEKALEDKGKRKFVQTVDLGINFRNIDFKKQENRLNLEVLLPKGRGKEVKVAVFADGDLALQAKKANVSMVIPGEEIPKMASDKGRLKSLLDYEMLAAPQLMTSIGRHLGQFLGSRGKLPKPVIGGSLQAAIERAKRTVRIRTKGKFLPVVHCAIGTENMSIDDLAENVEEVLKKVSEKVGDHNIASAYVKLTMGKPAYISPRG